MATIDSLKLALRQSTAAAGSSEPLTQQPLTDAQNSAGFEAFVTRESWKSYTDFIIPHLCRLLNPIVETHGRPVSILEIGPGPRSVLALLPSTLRRAVGRYTAYEPNTLFVAKLEAMFGQIDDSRPLPCLGGPPDIRHAPFNLDCAVDIQFDVVIFCHSMYGMKPKSAFIAHALEMLLDDGLIVVFHREGLTEHLDGLICHRTATWQTGCISVEDNDDVLDTFTPFVTGFVAPSTDTLIEWRETCRVLGRRNEQGRLCFSSPETMVAFHQHAATALSELGREVPMVPVEDTRNAIKNRQARLHRPAAVARPTEIRHVQKCVQWALKHNVGLTVLSGGHSGHCIWPNVVAVDMTCLDKVYIITADQVSDSVSDPVSGSLIVAEAGCKTGNIIAQAAASGLTVPLGARPSVGAGLWLQGGIGHLARLHGLACDAIVGAVVVSVATGDVLCLGVVPRQHQPPASLRPENEDDLLWALKGAGANVGIVISVTFRAFPAPTYTVGHWITPLANEAAARRMLDSFDGQVASRLSHDCSADAFLFWEAGQLQLGVSIFMVASSASALATQKSSFERMAHSTTAILGVERQLQDEALTMDGVGVFDAEMYMSVLHGGHGGGKTSAFKRCVFLKDISTGSVAQVFISATQTRPSSLCYLHLLHGGGAISDITAEATAFGCRDWNFACVITGVWPHDQPDGSEAATRWVYDVARDLLALPAQCCGVYGADLGPDPRDAALAERAFGPNRRRLACLKNVMDPHAVLAYTCPLSPTISKEPKLIVLVTGAHGAGKDFCADIWAREFDSVCTAVVASTSDATKREFASATPGVNIDRLLTDRAYKEQHRPALTAFFQEQVRRRPQLLTEHFMQTIETARAQSADVLFITGMRDEAPVAAFSPFVPHIRVIDIDVRRENTALPACKPGLLSTDRDQDREPANYRPTMVFNNTAHGPDKAEAFAQRHLLPLAHADLDRLAALVRTAPDFPRPGIAFRHVLDVAQRPGGLDLCTSLFAARLSPGDDHNHKHRNFDAVAACEAGGFVFAAALATRLGVPLLLARVAGKLPPPVVAVARAASHISRGGGLAAAASGGSAEVVLEMNCHQLSVDASVVVMDDVLASGETLCAVLGLLSKVGVRPARITAFVVAEFPAHRGREFLRQNKFGDVAVQSLLVFGGN